MARPSLFAISSGMAGELSTPPQWVDPLRAYLLWLHGLRRAEGTIYQHSYHLRRFAVSTGLPPWPVTLEQLVGYLGTLDGNGKASLRLVRQVLRGFYGWGVAVGRHPDNPAAHIPTISTTRGVPRPAPEHSVQVGLHAPAERTRLMILLAVRVGMRCVEIAQAHTDDVVPDLLGHSLLVRGKGDRQRLVPIPPDVVHAIAERPAGYIFPGQIAGHLSAAHVSKLISAALPPGVTAHQLRHRYATRAYQLGGRDIGAVQKLLGHAYVTTTQIYVAVDDGAVRRAALAAAG